MYTFATISFEKRKILIRLYTYGLHTFLHTKVVFKKTYPKPTCNHSLETFKARCFSIRWTGKIFLFREGLKESSCFFISPPKSKRTKIWPPWWLPPDCYFLKFVRGYFWFCLDFPPPKWPLLAGMAPVMRRLCSHPGFLSVRDPGLTPSCSDVQGQAFKGSVIVRKTSSAEWVF